MAEAPPLRPAVRSAGVAVLVLTLGALAAPALALAPPERVLRDRMLAAGLDRVEPLDAAGRTVSGLLPGEGELTVLLLAGCGPDGETSRDAALLAAADLARTPRRHTLEVLLCAGGDEGPATARRAAEGWLSQHPTAAARDAVLAALHLELDDTGGGSAIGLLLAGTGPQGRRLPPAWLAHAVLLGARAGGDSLAIGDPHWPLMGQLLGRLARPRVASGAGSLLAAGVPALTIVGGGRDAGWPAIVAGVARRLDSLAGRPRADDAYLVLAGRVWSRRDLYWAGLAVWVALVASGLPGAWRGTGSRQRRRRGRRYLPGFVLLAPAALLTLLPLRRAAARRVGRWAAALPAALFAGYWAAALALGRVALSPARPLQLALLVAGVVLAVGQVGRGRATSSASSRTARSHSSAVL
jgi:hypothetical protein